jgi:hypothetical protein
MSEDTVVRFLKPEIVRDALTELLREGAQRPPAGPSPVRFRFSLSPSLALLFWAVVVGFARLRSPRDRHFAA